MKISSYIASFIVRLRRQASLCEFENTDIDSVTNQLLRDQLIKGIKSPKLTEHILSAGNLSLKDTIARAEGMQQAINDSEQLTDNRHSVMHVNEQDTRAINTFSRRNRSASRNTHHRSNSRQRCYSCGKEGHMQKQCNKKVDKCLTCHKPGQCFKNKKCTNCLKIGHTFNVCRARSLHQTNSILAIESKKSPLNYVTGSFCDVNLSMLIDTGAVFSVISRKVIDQRNLNHLFESCDESAVVADGRSIVIRHCNTGKLKINDFCWPLRMYICDLHVDSILGMDILPEISLKIGSSDGLIFSITPTIVKKYHSIFDKSLKDSYLRETQTHEVIKTVANAEPKQAVVRSISKKHETFLNAKIEELLKSGVIVESKSPWRYNPVIVSKSDGTPRLTINYKPVNSVTVFDAFSLPRIEDLIKKLSAPKYFSTLDFSQCYHKFRL